jgi:hypothetical protein
VLQQNNTLTAVFFDDNLIGELGLKNLADAVPRYGEEGGREGEREGGRGRRGREGVSHGGREEGKLLNFHRAKSLREMPIPFADVARVMNTMDGGQARVFSKQLADIERELSSRRFRDNNAGL